MTADPEVDVAHAALVFELEQRDGAILRYEALRERYELARLKHTRKQRLMASHTDTLSQLRNLAVSVRRVCKTNSDHASAKFEVPDTLVGAVQVFLSLEGAGELDEKLQVMLSCHAIPLSQTVQNPGSRTGACEVCEECVTAQQQPRSFNNRVCEKASRSSMLFMRPLLHWSKASVCYRTHLLDWRCRLASELARAMCQVALLKKESANGSAATHATAKTQQYAVEEARAELKKAKDLKRCVKRRLYEVHQQLSKVRFGSFPADKRSNASQEAAVAMSAQIRRELQSGRVTLLRILCEGDSLPLLLTGVS